jgi:hypothetical protein
MSCCGKIASIVKGNVLEKADKLIGLPVDIKDMAFERFNICRNCDEVTWLTVTEYTEWLVKNGLEVVTHLDELETLPPLDKKPYRDGAKMVCRFCKCWLAKKVYVESEKCPQNKWI